MIEWLVIGFASVALGLGGVRVGVPMVKHAQHERCLVRIAKLEIDLGIRPDPLAQLSQQRAANYTSAITTGKWANAQQAWLRGASKTDPLRPNEQIRRCTVCHKEFKSWSGRMICYPCSGK